MHSCKSKLKFRILTKSNELILYEYFLKIKPKAGNPFEIGKRGF
jgi:hypothetical protein